jgi:hypothetical protein
MRPINLKAQKIMDRLTAGITEENSHTRTDNNEPNSAFMAVVVEWVGDCKRGDVYSIAHYYKQNGDLMADPKMDGLGIYREGVVWEDGEPRYLNAREQRDEAIFAGTWMENIKHQQF